jgi:hypothetical protein
VGVVSLVAVPSLWRPLISEFFAAGFSLDSALFTRESRMYEKLAGFSSFSLGRACLFVLCRGPIRRYDFR